MSSSSSSSEAAGDEDEDSEYIYSTGDDDEDDDDDDDDDDDSNDDDCDDGSVGQSVAPRGVQSCGERDINLNCGVDRGEQETSAQLVNGPSGSSEKNLAQARTLVAEMTGLSEDASIGLLAAAGGNVESAVALFFGSGTDAISNSESALHTPSWATVAEMTGLSTKDAKALIDSVGGDVETAVMVHFEGEAALIGGAQSHIGRRQRLQESRDEQMRLVGGTGYDAFISSKYKAPERKRKQK